MVLKPVIGLMTFTDPRVEVGWLKLIEDRHFKVLEALKNVDSLEIISSDRIVNSKRSASEGVAKLLMRGVEGLIMNIPLWTPPVLTLYAARKADEAKVPSLIFGDYCLSGILASSGALSQVGLYHKLVYGNLSEKQTMNEILSFSRSASAASRLRGLTLGVFGGRSLGMYSTSVDVSQWQRVFGVDVEHVDQLEIVKEAEKVPRERVERYMDWLRDNFGFIRVDGKVLSWDKLEKQVRSYIATKEIAWREGFDFICIKCQPELSDGYVNQCLTPSLMNDPYDADGAKEPLVCGCEVDHDGVLTMQILKILSGGKPTLFMDLLLCDFPERGLISCGNCGGMSTWYSKRSEDPKTNLKEVYLMPQIQGKAGGAATQFICASAEKATFARLYRVKGVYAMFITLGEIVEKPREVLEKDMAPPWPHAFIKIPVDPKKLLKTYPANHIHVVIGDYTSELTEFCEMLKIDYNLYLP